MIFVQLTGLSGAGKTTIANAVGKALRDLGHKAEVIDGDEYRKGLCRDLGFSRADRAENIRRLGFVGLTLAKNDVIAIMAAINPYDDLRQQMRNSSSLVRTVWIRCGLDTLVERDVKGLYRRAFLSDDDPEKIHNLTGVNDTFDTPKDPDLIIDTGTEVAEVSSVKLLEFILSEIAASRRKHVRRAMFIGRWQPFHNGHKWLIDQKLGQGVPVLIAVRDTAPDTNNPLSTYQTVEILKNVYSEDDVEIVVIPDIESVNFGRDVGYEINEFVPPEEIRTISASEIRESIARGSDVWKDKINEKIHSLVEKFLQP